MKKLTTGLLVLVLTSSLAVANAQQKKDTIKTKEIEGVVVTALGIKREKRSLGYSTTEVKGDQVANAPVANVTDALAGQVAGLNITQSGTMGGSANMVIRGTKSLVGNNQALVVVDGTPINNDTFNQTDIASGVGAYDYSNGMADINPNDIESVNVLKGAAASALYGSRGMNGVIMITTKKGKKSRKVGVEFNSSTTLGFVDKSTLPKYQKEYGGGYSGDSFYPGSIDINGDGVPDHVVYTYDDASFGTRFDPKLMVYNWDSQYPQLPGYLKPTPFVAGKDPNSIWGTATTFQNSVAFSAGNEKGKYRLGYTNFLQDGSLDNSTIKKNTIDFSADYNFTEKLNVFGNISYVNTKGKGRVLTGYDSRNPMQSFRQWWNMSVDMDKQRQAYNLTGQNMTWNIQDWSDQSMGYTDNYFFNRYQNYQTDNRNRYYGNFGLNYKITDWLSTMVRYTFDTFDELREERVAKGSSSEQGRLPHGGKGEYYFLNHKVSESNYDVMLNVNKDFGSDFNLTGTLGWNLRTISSGSGFTGAWMNSGDIENKGVEARLTVVPIKNTNFKWEMTANWSKNKNTVTRISGDSQFLQLAKMWNVTTGAQLGESTGTIRGYDFVYLNGERVVGADGKYLQGDNPTAIIGDAVPKWRGGLLNTITYKNFSLSFLIDVKKGGDVYSRDMAYGLSSGLYEETAGLNDLGNPIRNSLADGGGVILPGVKADGTPNDIRADFTDSANPYGYTGGSGGTEAPEKMHVYDGSFVKLRNVTISYRLPKETFGNSFIESMTLSLIGRNLWIIHKNTPYTDPEAGMSAGNAMGFQNGAHPAFREIGASVKVEF
ncbi:hypothetical protein BBI01_12520 [Chryseobacterium artocarpi]|uniref:TonB-dependent receptor plug domain-containing protein n=1 Tax=Chryseobacterium artocarpi TaxID=1414727 RepID=A0A1B8ZGM8_9FLAO|nr:TonB-dependent receptor plug domain-containing protein [Chryseobacterium artocarpi]OCA70758.1 hypothetical protein BBI01_12520 [Chryseobacterium artocarpi]